MTLLDLLITAIALSMDAFAVSIGKGLSVKRLKASHCLITGAYFGGFQALMPLLGFLLASSFASYIQKFDHWIACVLLVLIGANMLREAFSKEEEQGNDSFAFRVMLPLAIATSIDALATGVTYYRRYNEPLLGRPAVVLPSTSPANAAWSLQRLAEAWRVIL